MFDPRLVISRRAGRSTPSGYAMAAITLLAMCTLVHAGFAQSASSNRHSYDIPAGSLTSVLSQFADRSQLSLVYSAALTEGMASPGLRGDYSSETGLRQLLANTGLTYRFTDSHTVTIEKSASRTRELAPLRVEGADVAATGAIDATSTENSGSYTTDAVTIGSKAPQSIRDTPQSVSVVTRQQLQDENLQSFEQLMNAAPGVSVNLSNSSPSQPQYYSRGLLISAFQIDGGAPVDSGQFTITGYTPQFDMAEFDHVEILRGSDGLFAGYGTPAGTVNLVRKRALGQDQLIVEGAYGSWDNERVMVDVTGPLAFDGRLRGRVVVDCQQQQYFYDIANENHGLIFGTLEADLTPGTLLTLSGSYLDSKSIPWFEGLPRYANGAEIPFPRSVAFTYPWATFDVSTAEMAARIEQKISANWALRLDYSEIKQRTNSMSADILGAISPVNLTGSEIGAGGEVTPNRQYLADLVLTGGFDVFGRRQELVFGGSFQNMSSGNTYEYGLGNTPETISIFPFRTSSYPNPQIQPQNYAYPIQTQHQRILYGTLRLLPLERLHVTGGAQWASYNYYDVSGSVDPSGAFTSPPNVTSYQDKNRIVPYAGVVFDVDKVWSVYASFTNIFLSQANKLQAPFPPGIPSYPTTGAETEVGIKGDLMNGKLKPSLSVYHINLNNQVGYGFTGGYTGSGGFCCYVPDGKVTTEGIDAELAGNITDRWQIAASYNYNENKYDPTAGVPYTTVTPKHLAKLWTTYRLPVWHDRLTVGGGVTGQSSTFESGTVPASFDPVTGEGNPPFTPYNFTQAGWTVFSLYGEVRLTDHFFAALNLNNVTNKVYYQSVGNPDNYNWYGDPFNYMLTLRYKR
jgi:outer-membrane receptor for ferric coprogen and ferric-rhodotorulic acid